MSFFSEHSKITKVMIGVLFVALSLISLTIGATILNQEILIMSRIPRLLAVITAGAAMAIAGLIMQSLTQNRFVSPTTAGTLSFAKLGVLLSILFLKETTIWGRLLLTFVMALVGSFIFIKAIEKVKLKNLVFVPLLGIMLGNVIDSITTYLSIRFDVSQLLNTWTQGSFTLIIKGRYELLFLIVPVILFAYRFARQFTIVGMGEQFANNLGVNYQRTIQLGLLIVSLLSATVLSIVGAIPFVGLIIPNLVRYLVSDKVEDTLWLTAITGSILLLMADIISRTIIFPFEISIHVTIGVIGSLIFIWMLFRTQRSHAK